MIGELGQIKSTEDMPMRMLIFESVLFCQKPSFLRMSDEIYAEWVGK